MTTAFVLPAWVLWWTAFLPPLAGLGAAALGRRAHARSGDTQPWVEAVVVGKQWRGVEVAIDVDPIDIL